MRWLVRLFVEQAAARRIIRDTQRARLTSGPSLQSIFTRKRTAGELERASKGDREREGQAPLRTRPLLLYPGQLPELGPDETSGPAPIDQLIFFRIEPRPRVSPGAVGAGQLADLALRTRT